MKISVLKGLDRYLYERALKSDRRILGPGSHKFPEEAVSAAEVNFLPFSTTHCSQQKSDLLSGLLKQLLLTERGCHILNEMKCRDCKVWGQK